MVDAPDEGTAVYLSYTLPSVKCYLITLKAADLIFGRHSDRKCRFSFLSECRHGMSHNTLSSARKQLTAKKLPPVWRVRDSAERISGWATPATLATVQW